MRFVVRSVARDARCTRRDRRSGNGMTARNPASLAPAVAAQVSVRSAESWCAARVTGKLEMQVGEEDCSKHPTHEFRAHAQT